MENIIENKSIEEGISFTVLLEKKYVERPCLCIPEKYVIDSQSRTVFCEKCGKNLDNFDVIMMLSDYIVNKMIRV